MAYATYEDVQRGFRQLDSDEQDKATALLDEAAVIIDAYASSRATDDAKKVVSVRLVRRALGDDGGQGIPIGASQGTVSAMGYSQSFTFGSGSSGELYLSKLDKKLLGVSGSIGSHSPLEDLGDD